MSKFYIARKEDMACSYNEDGFGCVELLADSHDGSVHNYKCYLKAGSKVAPKMYADKIVLFFFGKGKGYVTDQTDAYPIEEEVSFYFPDFDKNVYEIHAIEDMEFVMAVVDMYPCDWEDFKESHLRLPYFRPLSKCVKYDQDCKGPHTTSWHVLNSKHLGHVILGVVRANGEGTIEKGHPSVHQWNYCLGDSDFDMTVDGETVHHVAGEWSFIPAGPDHSLVAQPGKEVFYVWFEQFTRKDRDFIVKPDAE